MKLGYYLLLILFSFQSLVMTETKKKEKTPLLTVAPEVSKLIKLSWKGKTLTLDFEHWRKPYKDQEKLKDAVINYLVEKTYTKRVKAVEQVDQQPNYSLAKMLCDKLLDAMPGYAGSGGSGSSSGGDTIYETHSTGTEKIKGKYKLISKRSNKLFRKGTFKLAALQLKLQEQKGEKQSIEFSYEKNGRLALSIGNKKSANFYQFIQEQDASVLVKYIENKKIKTLKAVSFLELYFQNRNFMEKKLFPALKRIGIQLPFNSSDAAVLSAVMQRIRPHSEKEQFEIRRGILGLFSPRNYVVQESKEIFEQNFYAWYKYATTEFKTEKLSDKKKGLLKIFIKEHKNNYLNLELLLDKMKFGTDAQILISLLEGAKAVDKKVLIEKLEDQTKQNFGDNEKAWRKWGKEQISKETK